MTAETAWQIGPQRVSHPAITAAISRPQYPQPRPPITITAGGTMAIRRRAQERAALAGAASAAAAEVVATVPRIEPDPSAAAFFDVDNTMMIGASMFHFARGLAARDLFTTRDLVRFAWQQVAFRIGGHEDQLNMASARQAALAFVADKEVAEIVRLCEEIYDDLMAERIWSGTRALAEQHLEAGQRVWLVTATPVELAAIVARRLGLTGALGTVAEVQDGRYTGRLVGDMLHGQAKAEALLALAAREGLDLSRCSAYSDSVNDLPMLSLVGHPMAINPDPDLKRHARQNGWPIRDFRTARKAAKIGVPAAAGVGAVGGGIIAGLALRKRLAYGPPPGPASRVARSAALGARQAGTAFAGTAAAGAQYAGSTVARGVSAGVAAGRDRFS
jgi:HAD superfamily hydrolase (TIGR01490 family)